MTAASALAGKEIALSGRLFSMSRTQAVQRILRAGGRPVREPGPATAILVAGNALTPHPRGERRPQPGPLPAAEAANAAIRLVEERSSCACSGQDELEDFSACTPRSRSAASPGPRWPVRSWVRRGLLRPARLSHRLAWFGFQDILTARNLARLSQAGVPAATIHRSLSKIAGWLPEGDRILGQLEAYAAGLSLRLPDGGRAEPSGQRLMDFPGDSATQSKRREEGQARADVPLPEPEAVDWFSQGLEAEERGELQAAAELYTRALEASARPDVLFNLGNVLYELGQEALAAERYPQAGGRSRLRRSLEQPGQCAGGGREAGGCHPGLPPGPVPGAGLPRAALQPGHGPGPYGPPGGGPGPE
jgi:hypothetical protein